MVFHLPCVCCKSQLEFRHGKKAPKQEPQLARVAIPGQVQQLVQTPPLLLLPPEQREQVLELVQLQAQVPLEQRERKQVRARVRVQLLEDHLESPPSRRDP
ncbi:MAG: hypothetical protein JNL01_03400 [Bdellovibrionales bacterium]|nr:hypothetical protein [Bdellovibrionales bacterium]